MNFYQCNHERIKLTNSQIINTDSHALDARENNPNIEGSLRNEINKKLDSDRMTKNLKSALYYGIDSSNSVTKWQKIASCKISSGYGNVLIKFEIVAGGSTRTVSYINFFWRIFAGELLTQEPYNILSLINKNNFPLNNVKSIITQTNDNGIISELWAISPVHWSSLGINVNIIDNLYSSIELIKEAIYSENEPSGLYNTNLVESN